MPCPKMQRWVFWDLPWQQKVVNPVESEYIDNFFMQGKQQKALNITDYSEDQLLVAFQETCSTIGPLITLFRDSSKQEKGK